MRYWISRMCFGCGASWHCCFDRYIKKLLSLQSSHVDFFLFVIGSHMPMVVFIDFNDEVLALCAENVERSAKLATDSESTTMVFNVDWLHIELLSDAQKEALFDADVALAADCIYIDDASDALLSAWCRLLKPSCRIFVSAERRWIFSSDTLQVCSPHYDYFMSRATALGFGIEPIDVDSLPHLSLPRVDREHLYLFKISLPSRH
jgi:SAM-dependent methyltransferase